MPRSLAPFLSAFALGFILLALGLPEAQAQSRRGQQAPTHQRTAPSPGAQSAPARPGGSDPAGTRLPSYAQPSNPPSPFSQPPSEKASGGQAQTNSDAPSMPATPSQVPLGGAEWLAAAGAAYALNRLRKKNGEDDEDEESDDMP